MSWLPMIKRDGNLLTMNIEDEVFCMPLTNLIGSIRWIERFADGIVANKKVKVPRGVTVGCCTLAFWQGRHDLVHWWISLLMPGQTKHSMIRCYVVRIPGCEGLWNWLRTRWQKGAGMCGHGDAVVKFQRIVLVENGNG